MSNYVNLLPVILVALGALTTLAAEPFIKDENKHKILPWVATLFIAFGAGAYYLTTNDTFMDLYAMDPIRRVLGLAVMLCAFLGISGLQWTLGHEKFKGGEAYALLMLATCGALLMTHVHLGKFPEAGGDAVYPAVLRQYLLHQGSGPIDGLVAVLRQLHRSVESSHRHHLFDGQAFAVQNDRGKGMVHIHSKSTSTSDTVSMPILSFCRGQVNLPGIIYTL